MKENIFTLKFLFKPSFHSDLQIIFTLKEEEKNVDFEIIPQRMDSDGLDIKENLTLKEKSQLDKILAFNTQAEKCHWQQIKDLSPDEVQRVLIIKNLLKKLIEENKEDKRIILDGIGVDCQLIFSNSNILFKFRSPENGSNELELVEALLSFLENKFEEEKAMIQIESLEGYFGVEFPSNPHIVRLYSRLGYSKEIEAELRKRLSNLPYEGIILMDLSNFEGMGTIFYDSFKSFINMAQKIIWIGTGRAKEQILEMGVNPKSIFKTKAEAITNIQQNFDF